MTAKTRTGFRGDDSARGADPGTAHEQLIRDHRRPGRAEGASIHSFDSQPPDDRTSDDAGIADIHQGMPAGIADAPKGEGPDVGDTHVEQPPKGEGPGEEDHHGDDDEETPT